MTAGLANLTLVQLAYLPASRAPACGTETQPLQSHSHAVKDENVCPDAHDNTGRRFTGVLPWWFQTGIEVYHHHVAKDHIDKRLSVTESDEIGCYRTMLSVTWR